MTLEEQLDALRKAQEHYEVDVEKYGHCKHKEANMEYTPVEKRDEYASKGVAGTGLGLGIAGTALALLSNGGLGNLGLGGANASQRYITKDEGAMMQQLTAKDSEIALLKADKYTDQKISDAYRELQLQINALKDGQCAINTQQAVMNATQTAQLSCLQQQVAQLQSLTKLVVPNGSVCPGWGDVTVTPASTATASA